MRAINAENPDARLTFIVGADTARTLPSWRDPLELLELAGLAVATRTGTASEEVLDTLTRLGAPQRWLQQRLRFLTMEPVEVSSSMVRERVSRGEPIERLVGSAVAGYISEHGLYRAPVEAIG